MVPMKLDITERDINLVLSPGYDGPPCHCAGHPIPITPWDVHEAWVWSLIRNHKRERVEIEAEAKDRIRTRAVVLMQEAFATMTGHEQFAFLCQLEEVREKRRELGIEFHRRASKLMN